MLASDQPAHTLRASFGNCGQWRRGTSTSTIAGVKRSAAIEVSRGRNAVATIMIAGLIAEVDEM